MAKYRALRRALRYLVWFVYKRVVTLLSVYFQPNSLSSAVILFAKARSAMTLENAGYHVGPGEAAVLARKASVASCLRLAAANTSGAAELLLAGTGCLRVGRRS